MDFQLKNNSLFAYTLVLLKRLPDESSKKSLIQTVENVISEYSDDIDLKLIGFPENYMEIMKNNLWQINNFIFDIKYNEKEPKSGSFLLY